MPWETLQNRRISDEFKQELEEELTRKELTNALFENMKPHSVPGIDGFSVLFVREFWVNLVDLVWLALLSMKEKGRLTKTLRTAILKLLCKGDNDPTFRWNYRPIPLLSVFYKVASCAITNILNKNT